MKGALYTIADLAIYLRCTRSEVERLIEEDGLPKLDVPGKERPKIKIAPRPLCEWINRKSQAYQWSIDDLIADIDRALEKHHAARLSEREAA